MRLSRNNKREKKLSLEREKENGKKKKNSYEAFLIEAHSKSPLLHHTDMITNFWEEKSRRERK